MSGWLRAWLPALAWAALIFLASSRTGTLAGLEHGLDKLAHFATYLVLGLALGRARRLTGLSAAAALTVGLLYALSDELHQRLVPGRTAELGDWVADALGVGTGLFLYHHWRRRADGPSARPARVASDSSPS